MGEVSAPLAVMRGLAAAAGPAGTPTLVVEQQGPHQVLAHATTGPPGEQAVAFWEPALPPRQAAVDSHQLAAHPGAT